MQRALQQVGDALKRQQIGDVSKEVLFGLGGRTGRRGVHAQMKLLNITIPASSSVNQDVPPSYVFLSGQAESSGGSLDVQLYGESGALLATLDNLETGTSYKSADLGQPFVTMRLRNNSPAANTLAAYVGLGRGENV